MDCNGKAVYVSLDIETGGENCGIIQLIAQIFRMVQHKNAKLSKQQFARLVCVSQMSALLTKSTAIITNNVLFINRHCCCRRTFAYVLHSLFGEHSPSILWGVVLVAFRTNRFWNFRLITVVFAKEDM